MQNTTLNLYPTTSSSTAEISTADLQQQLYLNMKSKLQDQAADAKVKTFLFLGGLIPHVSTCYGIIPSLLRTRNQMQDLLDITEDMADFEEHKANTQETRANMEQRRANVKHERANREHDRENMMRTYLMLS
ncbi:hypothetical protein Tco_0941654 [Tanacetum coccineum]|uniref:Uncharacterized protein n=1 Tax=Tanacetum coccineum TaxID=301880 RepID=A0ABQ5DXH4_9ASTR